MSILNENQKDSVFSLTFKASPTNCIFYILLTIISALMSTVVSTYATAYFVDYALEILNSDKSQNQIYIPLAIMLFVLLFTNIINPVILLIKKRILLVIKRKYQPFFLEKKAKLDYYNIENKDSWELISRATREPEEYFSNGFSSIMTILTMVIYIISILGMIIMHVWWAAILITVFSAPMIMLSIKTGKKSYEAACDTEKFQRKVSYFEGILSDRESIEEREIFGYSEKISDKWWQLFNKGRKLRLKVQVKYIVLTKSSTMGLSLITIFIAITLVSSVISGNMTPGMYMGIIGAVLSVTHQMGWNMSCAVETIANANEYLNDFYDFFELNGDEEYLCKPYAYSIHFNTLEFCNVSFKYPGCNEYILKNMSFIIEKGRHYAFVGGNGAGKTTITKLLMGLYKDYEGEILLNRKELRSYSQDVLKALFSNVHQDFAKYNISLRDNILIGNISRSCEDFDVAIKSADLGDVIKELNNGIDTPLGKIKKDGQELSTGQWQRVAIARAVISKAPIKIFDEPTASLDPISESNIYCQFEKLMKGKTTIFISHRLGSTKISDEIMVIGDGRIVEHGTHDQLMNLDGQYAAMFESQRRWYQ